jgi:hypothetical protein
VARVQGFWVARPLADHRPARLEPQVARGSAAEGAAVEFHDLGGIGTRGLLAGLPEASACAAMVGRGRSISPRDAPGFRAGTSSSR